jgi:hypothetical protein
MIPVNMSARLLRSASTVTDSSYLLGYHDARTPNRDGVAPHDPRLDRAEVALQRRGVLLRFSHI